VATPLEVPVERPGLTDHSVRRIATLPRGGNAEVPLRALAGAHGAVPTNHRGVASGLLLIVSAKGLGETMMDRLGYERGHEVRFESEPVHELTRARSRGFSPYQDETGPAATAEEEESLGDEARPKLGARRIVVRLVGYLAIAGALYGTGWLMVQRPIREQVVNWTTFGNGERVRKIEHSASRLLHGEPPTR
jgi:hypothetical protein